MELIHEERRHHRDTKSSIASELSDLQELQRISSSMIEKDNIDALYEKILEGACAVMHSETASIQMLIPERNKLLLLAHRGFDSQSAAHWKWVGLNDASSCALAMARGERVVISDVENCEFLAGTDDLAAYRKSHIRATQSTQLISRTGRLLGMISTHWSHVREPSEEELRSFDVLARQAADLIEHRMTEETLRESDKQQTLLLKISDTIRSFEDPVEIQQTVLQLLGEYLQVTRVFYFLTEQKENKWLHIIESEYRRNPETPSYVGRYSINNFWTKFFANMVHEENIAIEDIRKLPQVNELEIQKYLSIDAVALIKVPLIKNKKYVAGIGAHDCVPRLWKTSEVEIIREVVSRIWSAIERARAETAHRESENRFRALVMASSSMLYQMNANWSEMICFKKGNASKIGAETPHKNWLETFIPVEEQQKVMEMIQNVIAKKSVFELEHRILREGKEGWAFSCAVPILNSQNQIVEWFGAATDITERKNFEQALKETDRRKDEFLAVLSHELRNPLFPLKNAIHVLKHDENNIPDQKKLIQIMERQVNHMVRLVDDLLEVSRIATAKIELHKETINLIDAINNAIEVSRPILDSYQHQLFLSFPSEPLLINADMIRITQVFVNLLNNAAKYTAENGIITINAFRKDNWIVISVQDNGIGISAKTLPTIFEMFTQDKHSLDLNHKGLGIGLAMVKNLVGLHGGSVEAISAGDNKGSEFLVYLPWDEKYKQSQKNKNLVFEKYIFSNINILIVDDNQDITESLAILLTSWKMNVRTSNDGNSALKIIEEFKPNIILLDIGMPDISGYEIAAKIRANPKFSSIKLVALTGWGQVKNLTNSRANGFNEHLTKPVDIDVLRKLFHNLIVEL